MTTVKYFDSKTTPTEFSIASFEGLKGWLVGDDTYRMRNDAGETLTFHGDFQKNTGGGKVFLNLTDAVFRNADGDKIAQLENIEAWGGTPIKLTDNFDRALSIIDKHVGSIGNDHILAWNTEFGFVRAYGLAGNDVITVDFVSELGSLYDGGLGRDTLNLSKFTLPYYEIDDPATVGASVSVKEGQLDLNGYGSSTMAHFERYVGTSYADDFEGSSRAETFDGRGGWDVIDGGGGADHFIFGIGYSTDLIEDFQVGKDKILIRGDLGFSNFKQLADFTTVQDNAATIIDFGADDVLLVVTRHGEHLSASDFIFQ